MVCLLFVGLNVLKLFFVQVFQIVLQLFNKSKFDELQHSGTMLKILGSKLIGRMCTKSHQSTN